MDNSGKLVLGYWPIRGLAERIRLVLEYTGLQYEQVFYYEHDEDKWFKEDKPKHLEKNPAANLPYLIDGEKIISESTAIIVHVCHKANRQDLLGRNAEEQVALATVFGVYKDFIPSLSKLAYTPDPNTSWEDSLEAFAKGAEGYLKKFSGLLGEKEYLCGGITWIDFVLADTLQVLNLMNPKILANHANLVKLQERIWSLPELQAYFGSSRWQEHPVNGE